MTDIHQGSIPDPGITIIGMLRSAGDEGSNFIVPRGEKIVSGAKRNQVQTKREDIGPGN